MDSETILRKYLSNDLSEAERIWFNRQYASDSVFRDEADEGMRLKKAIASRNGDRLRSIFQEIERGRVKRRLVLGWPAKLVIGAVASILIVFGMILYLDRGRTPTPEALFIRNFQPYENVIHPRERTALAGREAEVRAFRAYDDKEYERASQQFDSLYAITRHSYLMFYQGICAIELGKFEMAERLLQAHQLTNDEFADQGRWYLALLQLKQGNIARAKALLDSVARSDFRQERAHALRRELD